MTRLFHVVLVAGAAACAASSISAAEMREVRDKARAALQPAATQIMTWYNWSTGFFGDNKLYYPFWSE